MKEQAEDPPSTYPYPTRPIYVVILLKGGDRIDLPVDVGLPVGQLSTEYHVKAALKAALVLRPDGRIIGSY